jgi:Asp-tRNA(Asn)/Glu-tRNA(Gln) amidotransferase A subunit family amidase
MEAAKALDHERQHGKIRGPLHGIPIKIKVESPIPSRVFLIERLG